MTPRHTRQPIKDDDEEESREKVRKEKNGFRFEINIGDEP